MAQGKQTATAHGSALSGQRSSRSTAGALPDGILLDGKKGRAQPKDGNGDTASAATSRTNRKKARCGGQELA
jgi:hypothetical protein